MRTGNIVERNPKKTLLLLIIVLIALAEVAAGIAFEHLPGVRLQNGKGIVKLYLHGEEGANPSIIPHPYMLYANAPYLFAFGFKQHNSLGYRNEEFTVEKPPGTIRILAMGGSTTHMWPFIKNPKDTWVALLEEKLRQVFGNKIQVVNAGLPNATTAELLAGYVFRHRFLKPDIVIIHTGGNDVDALYFENYNPEYTHIRAHGSGRSPRKGERFLLKSNIMKVLYAFWLSDMKSVYRDIPKPFSLLPRDEVYERVIETNPEGFRRNLDYLIKLIKGDGARVVLLGYLQPRRERISYKRKDLEGLEDAEIAGVQKHFTIMERLSEKYDVPFFKFDKSLFRDEWFQDNCHLNEEGEKMKASVVFDFFQKHAFLGRHH